MKLWKVTVNGYGWDRPKTLYFALRDEAEIASHRFPASDRIEYAGNYTKEKASHLIDNTQYELTTDQHW